MPVCAASKRPRRATAAPVNAPRPWPKSSDSRRSAGRAATFTATKGARARDELWWITRASTSLPVPVSPVTTTGAWLAAKRAARLSTDCIDALRATMCVAPRSRGANGIRPHTLQVSSHRRCSIGSILDRIMGRLATAVTWVSSANAGWNEL